MGLEWIIGWVKMYLFEIHLTVNELTDDKISDFENLCQKLGGKAILIELPMGEHTQQPMMTYVKQANNITEILADIDNLKPQFLNQGFNIIRTKIEIPADQYDEYVKQFPDTKGYFEWHGKVEFPYSHNYALQKLRSIAHYHQAHLSQNSLKNNPSQRFITYRSNDFKNFKDKIDIIKQSVNREEDYPYLPVFISLKIIKEQAEYCVYDDKLSLDNGWSENIDVLSDPLEIYKKHSPHLLDAWHHYLSYPYIEEFVFYEGIIRRAVKVNQDFMLKGSFVTRQYFDNPNDRQPMDLDFLCLTPLPDIETANKVLNDWLTAVTRTNVNDGLYFIDFAENAFWRQIDYAMHDDFPTVTGEVLCYINGKVYDLNVEVSFNLPVPFEPVPLLLKTPIDEFIYPKTTPLSLQIAWKIHQTIVRPRVKDIYDLIYLVKKIENKQIFDDVLFALLQECEKDQIAIERVKQFFQYDYQTITLSEDGAWHKDCFPLYPDNNQILFEQFKENMQQAGFVLENLTLHYPNLQDEIIEMPIQDNITPNQEPLKNLWQKISGIFKE